MYLGKCGCAVAWQFSNFKNLCGPNGTLGGNFSTYSRVAKVKPKYEAILS